MSQRNPPDPQVKPAKSILKKASTEHAGNVNQQHVDSARAKFDEMNIIETLHPPDKDYGHMKIDEPKTPYNYVDNSANLASGTVDPNSLIKKLNESGGSPPRAAARRNSGSSVSIQGTFDDDNGSKDPGKMEFIAKRKSHYNEFQAMQQAKALLAAEGSDGEEENDKKNGKPCSGSSVQRK